MSAQVRNARGEMVTVSVVSKATGMEVTPGDLVASPRGSFVFHGIAGYGRTGTAKAIVRPTGEDGGPSVYYARVFDLVVEGENDEEFLARNGL